MNTFILRCTCTHEWQDKQFGYGLRVCNYAPGNKKTDKKARCTVCGKVHEYSKATSKK